MTQYTKPAVRNAWGQTATGSDIQDPGNTYASAGWQIGVKPPRQYFNWVLNYVFSGVRYLCQSGIPDWDANETYSSNVYVKDSSGYIYCSLINNNINNVPANTFGTAWATPAVRTPSASVATWQVPNLAWVQANFLQVGSTFGAISGQISSSQVPVGAVTQWQGSLAISGGQVNSAVSRANTLLNTSGNYATFNWSGQSGQPSWLWGSNDGVNYYVWNPSNFSVNNSNLLQGYSPTIAASGNTVGLRDPNGYFFAQYFNQSSVNNENPSISQFLVTNGADGYLRKASVGAVTAALGALTNANFAFSSAGYQRIANGAIIQGGRATVSGTTNITFPLTFPNGCFAVCFTNEGSTNQIFINGAPSRAGFQATNGNAVIDYISFGW